MINWNRASVRHGVIWAASAVVAVPMIWVGKDISQLLLFAGAASAGVEWRRRKN